MKFKKIINLGFHPYADTFIKESQLNQSEPIYLLSCSLSKEEGIIQNLIKTDPNSRYNLYDYSYTSSNSLYSKNYWDKYSKTIANELLINNKKKILEIGSNDGFLLKCFKKFTNQIVGLDASKTICEIARKNKIKTYNLLFNLNSSRIIKKKEHCFDLIIANNVLNHSNDVLDFIYGVKNLMKTDGVFIFEVPYWYYLVLNKKFDQIYHEHINYFTIKSSYFYLKKCGLQIFKIEETEYHGGSIRVYAKKSSKINKTKIINEYIKREEKLGLFQEKTYIKMMKVLNKRKSSLLQKILFYKSKGYKIVGIGAAAKANTMLNFLRADNSLFDYIADNSSLKINKYTPLSRIPIIADKKLKKIKKIYAIILTWNLEKILKNKLLYINKNIKYLEF
jgi:SAM-dependent methyltransferase